MGTRLSGEQVDRSKRMSGKSLRGKWGTTSGRARGLVDQMVSLWLLISYFCFVFMGTLQETGKLML